eukprot:TRINITY_DN11199_c0_g3_i3.p1 TRINITY_DN11199_c0_g3~~TRINITY_DN11199_c0_g3_i3.p1  ORF type:complete len:736 (+),score=150.32 TRINITY_DN11199_c0_g3_i3:206-2413(+)
MEGELASQLQNGSTKPACVCPGFQRVKVIGKGSFGAAILVRQGSHLYVQKEVVLSGMAQKEKDEALHEATVLKRLKHPHIIRYIDSGMSSTRLWIIMDYATGGDLDEYITKRRETKTYMRPEQALGMFAQTCSAIKYIHERKILHRDLKSKNVFLDKAVSPDHIPTVKLGDFGIAKVLDCTKAYAKTQIGTPYYLAPEICNDRPYSYRADSWALGVILFECLALHVPFNATSLKALVHKITRSTTPAIPAQYQCIAGLGELVNALLEKEPGRRPVVQEVLATPIVASALAQYNSQEATAAGNPKPPQSSSRQLPKTPGGRLTKPRRSSAAVVAAEQQLKAHQQHMSQQQANYNTHTIQAPRSNRKKKTPVRDIKAKMRQQMAQQENQQDVMWLGGAAPMEMSHDTHTPGKFKSPAGRPRTRNQPREHYFDQREVEMQQARQLVSHMPQQHGYQIQSWGSTMKRNPPSSQRTPGTSEKQRARRLHALKAEEMHRQRHRDIAAEQAQRQAALAQPVQAAPVYDPYRAAREAYMERQQQAALNAQRINEQLGRYVPVRHALQPAPSSNGHPQQPPHYVPAMPTRQQQHHYPQSDGVASGEHVSHAEQVRRAGAQRREQEQAAYQAQLEAARLEAERDRRALANRMLSGGSYQDHAAQESNVLDTSAMSVDEDVHMVDLRPLTAQNPFEGVSQQEQVLATKAQRQQAAEQAYLQQLEAARQQNLQDQRSLAERMGMLVQ